MKKALCFVLLVSLLLVSFTGCHREPERYKFMHNTTEITSIELVRLRDGENYVVCEIDDIDRFCADVGERWVYNSYVNPPPTPMLGELCLIVHYKNGDYQQIAYRLSCNMFHEPIDGKPGEEYYVRFDSKAEFYTILYSHSASMFSDISKCENLVESGAMDEKLRLETLNTYDMLEGITAILSGRVTEVKDMQSLNKFQPQVPSPALKSMLLGISTDLRLMHPANISHPK